MQEVITLAMGYPDIYMQELQVNIYAKYYDWTGYLQL